MDQSGITPNTSNQQLVINSDNESATALLQEKQSRRRENLNEVSLTEYMTVGILCFVNLINYMDRFTIADMQDVVAQTATLREPGTGLQAIGVLGVRDGPQVVYSRPSLSACLPRSPHASLCSGQASPTSRMMADVDNAVRENFQNRNPNLLNAPAVSTV
ncbi:hypothetical protein SFRURICE_013295 [Spodoptera frugiperda]|nr:hypothetical protein SFRURICE_013295 [Spodoptera frugiperda]